MNAATPAAPEGIVSVASPYSVAETLQRLTDAIQAKGLTLFARVDHSDEAAKVGLQMQPAHVLIFGAPKGGTPLMVAAPLLALELPLKALVWQSADGQVWVSYTDPAYLASRYGVPAALVPNIAGITPLIQGALA